MKYPFFNRVNLLKRKFFLYFIDILNSSATCVYLPDNSKLIFSRKPYFSERNRIDGERDIWEHSIKEKQEGAWLYSSDNNIWVNIRLRSKITKNGKFVFLRPFDYSVIGSKLTLYHTHPIKRERSCYPSLHDFDMFAEVKKN